MSFIRQPIPQQITICSNFKSTRCGLTGFDGCSFRMSGVFILFARSKGDFRESFACTYSQAFWRSICKSKSHCHARLCQLPNSSRQRPSSRRATLAFQARIYPGQSRPDSDRGFQSAAYQSLNSMEGYENPSLVIRSSQPVFHLMWTLFVECPHVEGDEESTHNPVFPLDHIQAPLHTE